MCLLSEPLVGISLFQMLNDKDNEDLAQQSILQRCRLALNIAKSIQYLHQCWPPISHSQVCSENILIGFAANGFRPKLCVGIHGFFTQQTLFENFHFWRWTPPELFNDKDAANFKTHLPGDIYGFGLLLFEIVFLTQAFASDLSYFQRNSYHVEVDSQSLQLAISQGLRPTFPHSNHPEINRLIDSCWNSKPTARPTINHVVEILAQLTNEELVLPKPLVPHNERVSQTIRLDLPNPSKLGFILGKSPLSNSKGVVCICFVSDNQIWIGYRYGTIEVLEFKVSTFFFQEIKVQN